MAGASPENMAFDRGQNRSKSGARARLPTSKSWTSISYVGSPAIVVELQAQPRHQRRGARRGSGHPVRRRGRPADSPGAAIRPIAEYNPADSPIKVCSARTSTTLTKAQLYDSADSVIQQLSQVSGVGQITLGGGALPSVRVELQPGKLNSYGIGLEDVRAAISAANADSAKGHLDEGDQRYVVLSNDQITKAAPYRDLVVAYRNGSPVLLRDVAQVRDSNENIRNAGLYNGKSAVLVIVYPMPGSNIVSTVAQIRNVLPSIEATLPHSVRRAGRRRPRLGVGPVLGGRHGKQHAVYRRAAGGRRSVRLPAVATPPRWCRAQALLLSIVGTFGPMYLPGYSIDNLSLMAPTIGTGFVESTMRWWCWKTSRATSNWA